MQQRASNPRGYAARPVSLNRASKLVQFKRIPRTTLIGYVWPYSPIYKAIKCARKPVTLDAYGMPRANVAGNDNANPTHPNTPALLTVPA